MIYLILNEYWAKESNVPQYISYSSRSISKIPEAMIRASDFIFTFGNNGSTWYYKDKTYKYIGFTSEERLVIKLKSVLV